MNIGLASKASGVSAKMIRYYENIALINVAHRTDTGYRQYSEVDIQNLLFIRRSRDLGFSIARIKILLNLWHDRDRQSKEVKQLSDQYVDELNDQIQALISIRDQLQLLSQSCHGDGRPECPIIDNLSRK
jgi:MerR family copper efflux transcriptional regulator